ILRCVCLLLYPHAFPTRRSSDLAALRLLDAVLRRGLPLEAALDSAARDLDRPDDRGLAFAIASEALRRLPDLDALIDRATKRPRSEEHTSELQSRENLVCRLLLE